MYDINNSLKGYKKQFSHTAACSRLRHQGQGGGSFWKSLTRELYPLSWNIASLFITDDRTQVIGAILRCSRSREITGVFVQATPARAGAPLYASPKRTRTTLVLPSAYVIRFMDNGAPLVSVCPSAPPDTPATLIWRNGDAKQHAQRCRPVVLYRRVRAILRTKLT